MACDQEIIVPEPIWQECLEGGRLLRRDLFATCVNRQLKPFKPAVAGLRYFISYYFDLGDISPWVRISARRDATDNVVQMRDFRARLAPRFPARDLRDEYQPYAPAAASVLCKSTYWNTSSKAPLTRSGKRPP